MGPLKGLKVLDLSRLLPGPLCTHFLVRMGAHVDKVEQPDGADYVRYLPPLLKFPDGCCHGAVYEALNAQKKNIVIDFKHSDGPGILRRIVKSYDILVEGNRPGVMQRLGIGYDDLKKENPRLIFCSLTGYGATGPYARRAGHDLNYMSLAGLAGMTGSGDSVPPVPGFQGADAAGAMQAVIGIQAAVIERFSTNIGQFVDVSLTEAAMALSVPALATQVAGVPVPRGKGPLDGGLQNYHVYRTKDGRFLAVGALESHFWLKFLKHVGMEHLAVGEEDKAAGPLGGQPVTEEVTNLFLSKTYAEWIGIAADCDACIEPVLSVQEMLQHPQHLARNVFLPYEQTCASDPPTALPPEMVLGPRMSAHPAHRLQRAAHIGEHTNEILLGAGFTDVEISQLRAAKAIV